MKYKDEFSDPALASSLVCRIKETVPEGEISFMEVCGTHTMSIHRYGIKSLLPENIRLLSGPGCPVCVTPVSYMDTAIQYSRDPCFMITTFGDLFRVPGSDSSLAREKALGADVKIVYSPLGALDLARRNREKHVIFLGIGFETTLPAIASAIVYAKEENMDNFSVLFGGKTVPNVLRVLAGSPDLKIAGLMLPGHVSAIIGVEPYRFLASEFSIPCAITGFEPLDILFSIARLLEMVNTGRPEVINLYPRTVKDGGNARACDLIQRVFSPIDSDWRGIGRIPESGLTIREEFARYDAARRFPIEALPGRVHPGCRCGEVLKGVITPLECPLFGKGCDPESPIGACMVSSEGTCAAYYKYGM